LSDEAKKLIEAMTSSTLGSLNIDWIFNRHHQTKKLGMIF